MFNVKSRFYNFYKYEDKNQYGQLTLSKSAAGKVKIAIYPSSQSIQDNINYKGANYIGITHSTLLDDKSALEYEGKKLKVLYVDKNGRYNQVFFAEI